MSRHHSPIAVLEQRIRRWVLEAFPRDPALGIDYDAPAGDPGWFGPDSVTWRIHADFPGMLSGGLCALMLQTLHPRVLAGVWDHSNFRQDLVGRLRRTTAFVGATTYAPCATAQSLVDRVRRIHAHVHGTAPDGQAYAANEPELLTWVHVTEAYAFLQGFRQLSPVALPKGAADRYFEEVSRIAAALGAPDAPGSEAQVHAYFHEMRPKLAYSERSRVVLATLARMRLPVPAARVSRDLFLACASQLLPDWSSDFITRSPMQRLRGRAACRTLHALGPLFRRALSEGVAARSCRRVGRSPELLDRFPDAPATDAQG